MNHLTDVNRRVTAPLARALAGCVLVAGFAAGCTSARSNLGTSDSSCYLALPTAAKAVGPHTRLLGVRLLTVADLRHQAPRLSKQLSATGSSTQRVCVLAFSGRFTSTSVSRPHGRPEGQVAVAVLTSPSNKLLGTFILERIPIRFSHSHIG
jgi:hypothetical protein